MHLGVIFYFNLNIKEFPNIKLQYLASLLDKNEMIICSSDLGLELHV